MNPTGDHEGVPAAMGAREPGQDLRSAIQRSLWSSALGLGAALQVGLLVVRAGVHEGALRGGGLLLSRGPEEPGRAQ